MAHFAEVNEFNEVQRVLVVPDEQEGRGHDYLSSDLGLGGTWLQTSYNATIRGRFAAPGMLYSTELDLFVERQPFASWTLDAAGEWQPPFPAPDSGDYVWSEPDVAWIELTA